MIETFYKLRVIIHHQFGVEVKKQWIFEKYSLIFKIKNFSALKWKYSYHKSEDSEKPHRYFASMHIHNAQRIGGQVIA